MPSTVLKVVLRERHWQKHGTFCKQYDLAATSVDESLVGAAPSRAQFARWLSGLVQRPHPDHCRVLEAMFPARTAAELFTILDELATSTTPVNVPPAQVVPAASLGNPPRHDVPSSDAPHDGAGSTTMNTLGEELAMSTDESARFVRQPRGTVDPDVPPSFLTSIESPDNSAYFWRTPALISARATRRRRTQGQHGCAPTWPRTTNFAPISDGSSQTSHTGTANTGRQPRSRNLGENSRRPARACSDWRARRPERMQPCGIIEA